MDFEFKLTYKLAAPLSDDTIMARLGEAGCTDALVGLGMAGHVGLEFVRDAASAEEAVRSAMNDVDRALPGAVLLEASPDFVGLSDAAPLLGCTRQNLRKAWLTHVADFPAPVHVGSTAIWHFAELIAFYEKRKQPVPAGAKELSLVLMRLNLERQQAVAKALTAAPVFA